MITTSRRILAVAAAAGAVLVALWYLAAFSPARHHLASAHKAYASAEQQKAQLESQAQGLQLLERQIPKDRQRLAALQAAVPSHPDLEDLLNQLHALAVASSVQLTNVNPTIASASSSSAASGPPSLQLSMTASGPYGNLTQFLSGLSTMPRTVVVDSISLTGTGNQLTASLTVRTFYTP